MVLVVMCLGDGVFFWEGGWAGESCDPLAMTRDGAGELVCLPLLLTLCFTFWGN